MTRWLGDWRGHRGRGEAGLDELLAGAWEDGAAAVAKVLDLQAGKAALLERWHRQQDGPATAGPAGPGGAVGVVCGELDVLLAAVTAETGPGCGAAHSLVISQLLAVQQMLIQLRAGLARRSAGKALALQLAGNARHAVQEAARTLAALPPGSTGGEAAKLAGLLAGWDQQLVTLARRIERLFDEAGDSGPRVPVPLG
jgi:hypothetical protein